MAEMNSATLKTYYVFDIHVAITDKVIFQIQLLGATILIWV